MASDVEELNVAISEGSFHRGAPYRSQRVRHVFNDVLEKMLSDSDRDSGDSTKGAYHVTSHRSHKSQNCYNTDSVKMSDKAKASSDYSSDSDEEDVQSYRAASRRKERFVVYSEGILKIHGSGEKGRSDNSTASSNSTTPYQSQRSRQVFNEEIPILIDAEEQCNNSRDSDRNSHCATPQDSRRSYVFREEMNINVALMSNVENKKGTGGSARESLIVGPCKVEVNKEDVTISYDNQLHGGDNMQSPRRPSSTQCLRSHHVVDETGENQPIFYSNDCELQNFVQQREDEQSAKSEETVRNLESSSSVAIRNGEETIPNPHLTYRSISTPYLYSGQSSRTSVSRKLCLILDTERESDDEESSRNDKTYREEVQDTFRLSVGSLETSSTSRDDREQIEMKRKQAFKEWCERKEREKRERLRYEQAKQPMPQPTMTEAQREESYRRWAERKKKETMRLKSEEILKKYKHQEELEKLQQRKQREKEQKLNQWVRKKEEITKDMQQKADREATRAFEAEARRRSAGDLAYRDWLRRSKTKPLPVPLNKGELSMRGSVSDMYINPVPWQPLK